MALSSALSIRRTPTTPTVTPRAGRAAIEVVERLSPGLRRTQDDLQRVDDYLHGKQDRPYKPSEQDSEEARAIMKRSVSNVLPLVIDGIEQTCRATGYRTGDSRENAAPWKFWQANGWNARQVPLYRASLAYGMAYTVVLPGDPVPVMRPVSPRRMHAVYQDQAGDEWPVYALEEASEHGPDGKPRRRLKLYDDEDVHYLAVGDGGPDDLDWIESRRHGLGLCPVVRYPCELDLEGRWVGEIEPLIAYQDQLNQTTFDTNMVQSFGAFVIRTLTGGNLPGMPGTAEGGEEGDREVARRAKLQIGADRILAARDPDARFGSLPATPLEGHLASRDQKLRDLALRAQLPPHALLGTGTNVNAEALAATEVGLRRRGGTRRTTWGESHEQTLRLAGWAGGDQAAWEDRDAAIVWGDTEARSLAQTADAIVKLAGPELQTDPDLLLPMVPGFTQRDIEQARDYREKRQAENPIAELDATLRRQAGGVPGMDPSSRTPAGEG